MEKKTAVTINNRVLLVGALGKSGRYTILEYDPESEEWKTKDRMRLVTSAGVSVVDFTDYADFCQ